MKLKIALASATALGLVIGGAALADDNRTKIQQNGDFNEVTVSQDGTGNVAGLDASSAPTAVLRQTGDHNTIDIDQVGDHNRVGGNHGPIFGAHQTGNHNTLTVEQSTGTGGNAGQQGSTLQAVRQTSANDATGATNTATVLQERPGTTGRTTHFISRILQNHTGGAENTVDITQIGARGGSQGGQVYSGDTSGNKLLLADQNGSGNSIVVYQYRADSPTTDTAILTGPRNHIGSIVQVGDGHDAEVRQIGYQNHVAFVSQGGDGNSAYVSLTGTNNGATPSASNTSAVGAFTSGRGAEATGASASTVFQSGTGNGVNYTVSNGNNNQFGFYQVGTDNQAVGILITGNANELGVHQDGTGNKLELGTIAGSDNVVGLKQNGVSNVASINITHDRNVGYNDFGLGVAGDLAGQKGLTAGLLEQYGTGNQVTLTVSGFDNVFASLQDNSLHPAATQNVIVANITGNDNQAAVVQQGNNNHTSLTQNGGSNNVSISQ
jgi:hypothetical protein